MAGPKREAKKHEVDPETHKEAENLAREALEEIREGHKDEGQFLIDEARHLDKSAVEEVLDERGKPKAKPSGR